MSNHHPTRWLLVAALLGAAATSHALADGTMSLAWDPVVHVDLAGYRVFYDSVPGAYGSSVDVGNVAEATLTGLLACTDYHVAVKAYDSSGTLSAQFSNSVSGWARPALVGITPGQLERNSTGYLVIDGANFRAGATVAFSDPSISVLQVVSGGCHQLQVEVSVGADVGMGPVEVRVINPDQVVGVGTGLLEIVDDSIGPNISSVAVADVGRTTASIDWLTDEPASSAVFYRLSFEQLYQPAPPDPALVTDHHVQLVGLQPDSTYEIYVESVDSAGNVSVSGSTATFTTQSSPYVYIRIEAEDALLTLPIGPASGPGAFEGTWIEPAAGTPIGTGSDPAGTAEMEFHLPHAATWRLWARAYGTSFDGDAWFESVDGSVPHAFWTPGIGAWYWVELRTYDLSAGLHGLTLGGLEAEARVDRILVTDDPTFEPSEQPGADVIPPDAVSDLVATGGDGINRLSWTNPVGENGIRVVVRYRTDGQPPLGPADGVPWLDATVVPGSLSSFEHNGLANGMTYTYSVFVIDPAGNASPRATVVSTPAADFPDDVENLVRTDVL
jgi:chitodextrinase